MSGRFGSVLTLKAPRKATTPTIVEAPQGIAQEVTAEVTQERTHRPPVGARRFSRSKALADGLRAALKAREDSYEDLPSDINGNC